MANAGFQNYRPIRTFWYIETNVVLRRPPTPISKLLFEPYLLHYLAYSKTPTVINQLSKYFVIIIVEQISWAIFQGGGLWSTTFVSIYQNVRIGL